MIRVDSQIYSDFIKKVCLKAGYGERQAEASAKYLVMGDRLGIYTHGTYYFKKYIKKAVAGGVDVTAEPAVVSEGPSWSVVDGCNGVPVYIAHIGLQSAMKKAHETGVSFVTIRNSGHFGACGVYAVEAAQHGYFALVFSNTPPNMSIPGTKGATCGNSPIAFAAPSADGKPVFMDFALSATAGTRVLRYRDDGKPIPEGWIVDANGVPSTDYSKPYVLAPMAAHKGYCLSVMVEIMAAILSGGSILHEQELWIPPAAVARTGHCFVLIDVKQICGLDVFCERMKNLTGQLKASPLAEGTEKVWIPGEKEWEHFYDSEENGLMLPDDTVENGRWLAEQYGIPFPEACA